MLIKLPESIPVIALARFAIQNDCRLVPVNFQNNGKAVTFELQPCEELRQARLDKVPQKVVRHIRIGGTVNREAGAPDPEAA